MDLFYAQIDFGIKKHPALQRTLHVTIPEDLDYVEVFDDLFAEYTENIALSMSRQQIWGVCLN